MKYEREHMSSVDTAWLRMERPANLMMITSVMILKDPLEFTHLKKAMEQRFLSHRRFNQRVVQEGNNAYWEIDPDFDLNRHIHRVALPGAAGKEELEEFVSDLRSTPLDFSKPLWQMHLVENYQGGVAFILRIHHCCADGIALIYVLLSMTDVAPFETKPPPDRYDKEEVHGIFERFFEPATEFVNNTLKFGRGLLEEISHPSHLIDYAKQGTELIVETAKLAIMPNDPDTLLKGKLTVSKRVAWSNPISLAEVQSISKILGCSINDVVLSAVSGALRAYLIEKGGEVNGIEIRAAIPVNLRHKGDNSLGNHFGLVLLTLPLGISNPIERLYKVREFMKGLKGSYQALASFGIMGILGYGPNSLEQPALELLSKKATLVMSNVPGPLYPLYLAGSEIKEIMFWVPQTGEIGIGVSILSYNQHLQFGIMSDERLISDPRIIVRHFMAEFEKLVLTTLMEPWDAEPNAQEIERFVKSTFR